MNQATTILTCSAFHIVKNPVKHRKTRYRGLEKDTGQIYSLFGFANLLIVKKRLIALYG